jgi:tRNA threonylcarbamoyladenosine biosynthesis protein TsaB
MTGILAIDTSTEACSVAVYDGEVCRDVYEVTPRKHSQRLFTMLQALLPHGRLREQGIDAIAYSCGPGSFTGLRIAAGAVQGLAYSNGLPAVAVSTLALQAQTALRLGQLDPSRTILSMIDARINEVYFAACGFRNGLATLLHPPVACPPAAVEADTTMSDIYAIGSGSRFHSDLPEALRARIASCLPDLLPSARDLVPLALDAVRRGDTQRAEEVQPLYVRDEVNWKKISEQGRQS